MNLSWEHFAGHHATFAFRKRSPHLASDARLKCSLILGSFSALVPTMPMRSLKRLRHSCDLCTGSHIFFTWQKAFDPSSQPDLAPLPEVKEGQSYLDNDKTKRLSK